MTAIVSKKEVKKELDAARKRGEVKIQMEPDFVKKEK